MQLAVRREFIDAYCEKNYPNAMTKLSGATGIPAESLRKVRLGWVPKDRDVRQRLATALGVSESELFAPLDVEK